jgi:hypothetical protein
VQAIEAGATKDVSTRPWGLDAFRTQRGSAEPRNETAPPVSTDGAEFFWLRGRATAPFNPHSSGAFVVLAAFSTDAVRAGPGVVRSRARHLGLTRAHRALRSRDGEPCRVTQPDAAGSPPPGTSNATIRWLRSCVVAAMIQRPW